MITLDFLVCTGREQEFYYNDLDFTEESTKSSNYFDMSPLHPFRIIFNFIFLFGGNVGIPLLYGLTYKFTMKQNKIVPGLSDEAKQKRRHKNMVSIRFNLMNWMLESVMILMIFLTTDKMFQTAFRKVKKMNKIGEKRQNYHNNSIETIQGRSSR